MGRYICWLHRNGQIEVNYLAISDYLQWVSSGGPRSPSTLIRCHRRALFFGLVVGDIPLGSAPRGPFSFGQSGQIVFGHIVLLAIPSGGVLFATTGNLAYLAAIDPLSLWSEPAISPHLLVVPEAIPFGDLGFTASLYQAPSTPFLVFALGRKPAMPADLLIVTGTVPGRASFPPTPLCFANRPPLGLDNFCFHFASFLGISSFCLKISKYNATF